MHTPRFAAGFSNGIGAFIAIDIRLQQARKEDDLRSISLALISWVPDVTIAVSELRQP